MRPTRRIPKARNTVWAIILGLLAGSLVLSPASPSAVAIYSSFDTAAIRHNDQICNLGNPAQHLSPASAFEVSTAEQLWEVTDCSSISVAIHFKLTSDLNLAGLTNTPTSSPIGYSTSNLAYTFSGVLDGQNHAITNLFIDSSNYGAGLFAHLNNASISNLVISGLVRTTSSLQGNAAHSAGGLAIRSDGSLHLSSISNRVDVHGQSFVGGLVGRVAGTANLSGSNNHASVSAVGSYAGGFIGYANNANVHSSTNLGHVQGQSSVGGLVGMVYQTAYVESSSNTGVISGGADVGGLVGFTSFGNFETSLNRGTVQGADGVGGLLGFAYDHVTVERALNSASISGGYDLGGLVGSAYSIEIDSSYNTGLISGTGSAGGLVGFISDTAQVLRSYNAASISATSNLDGLIGGAGGAVDVTAALSSFHSRYVSITARESLETAAGFTGQDLVSTWGYGVCSVDGRLPLLRALNSGVTFYTNGCFTPMVPSNPAPSADPGYQGPIFDQTQTTRAGSHAIFTGTRLASIESVFIGELALSIISLTREHLVLAIPASLTKGSYDLDFRSQFGKLTFQNALVVLEPELPPETQSPILQKITVVASKGKIDIYSRGHHGDKLSVKISGKWLVVPMLNEWMHGGNISRVSRKIAAGKTIQVSIYLNGSFVKSQSLVTE